MEKWALSPLLAILAGLHAFDPSAVLLFSFFFFFFLKTERNPPSETGRENKPVFAWWTQWMKGPSRLIPIMSRDVKAAQKLHTSRLCEEETERTGRVEKKDAEHGTPWALT